MYTRSYCNQDRYQANSYFAIPYTHPFAGPWDYPKMPQKDSMYYQPQTPFEQFQKPKQPDNWYQNTEMYQSYYPNQKQNGLFAYFQDKDGQMDLDKMFSTVGQLATTVKQISPVVKQVGDIMKEFK